MDGGGLGYTKVVFFSQISSKLAAILIDLVDGDFWWVEIQPLKKACELALESTSLSSKSPLLRLLPIDALLSKGLVHLAVQVSCSTLSLRTGQDFQKHTAHWDLLCCSTSVLWRDPPPAVLLSEKCKCPSLALGQLEDGDIPQWKQ